MPQLKLIPLYPAPKRHQLSGLRFVAHGTKQCRMLQLDPEEASFETHVGSSRMVGLLDP
jgi:hypothetical protein